VFAGVRIEQNARSHGTSERRTTTVGDHLDVPLEDADLMEEVELISTLMIAAGESEEQLDQQRIDELLGVTHPGDEEPDQPPT
jgi:hypothetical protein